MCLKCIIFVRRFYTLGTNYQNAFRLECNERYDNFIPTDTGTGDDIYSLRTVYFVEHKKNCETKYHRYSSFCTRFVARQQNVVFEWYYHLHYREYVSMIRNSLSTATNQCKI